jgi:hypothetical protein
MTTPTNKKTAVLYDDHDIPCSEMRTLPTGGGGNAIVSRQGYEKEMMFRRERIRAGVQFDLPEWASLPVYAKINGFDCPMCGKANACDTPDNLCHACTVQKGEEADHREIYGGPEL